MKIIIYFSQYRLNPEIQAYSKFTLAAIQTKKLFKINVLIVNSCILTTDFTLNRKLTVLGPTLWAEIAS